MQKIIEFYNFNRRKIVLTILFIITGIACFYGIYFFNVMKAKADTITLNLEDKDNNLDDFEEISEKKVEKSLTITEKSKYKVDIKGLVKKPGVYELNDGSRINDVITKAGGLLKNADTSVINLSKKITDEMVIIIYSKEEVKDFFEVLESKENKNEACVENNGILKNDACINSNDKAESTNTKDEQNSLVNINTATLEQLQTLTGIGESKAKAIISYRNENGKFEKIEDVKNVSGIGEALFEKIKNNITV